MGLSYKQSSVPATLREGEFAVVNGVTYVGNSDDEPIPLPPFFEYVAKFAVNPDGSIGATTEINNNIPNYDSLTWTKVGNGHYRVIVAGDTTNYIGRAGSYNSAYASVQISYVNGNSWDIQIRGFDGSLTNPSGGSEIFVHIKRKVVTS